MPRPSNTQQRRAQIVDGMLTVMATTGYTRASIQAIARAAGIDAADVTSPTFTLWQTHRGSITLHHLDAYRIADEDEFLDTENAS